MFSFQLTTRVSSCEAAQISTIIDGKKTKLSGYEVKLEDTVLFPEGGGQVRYVLLSLFSGYVDSLLYLIPDPGCN